MIVTVDVPNINLELACLIRDACAKWGIEDYTVVNVQWRDAHTGTFVVREIIQTKLAFRISNPYLDWDQRKQTTLEVV